MGLISLLMIVSITRSVFANTELLQSQNSYIGIKDPPFANEDKTLWISENQYDVVDCDTL